MKSGSFRPEIRLIDIGRPILTIPRLAIHMNRRANEGIELNPQKDLLPLMGLDQHELTDHFFLDFLSEKYHRSEEHTSELQSQR